MQEGKESVATAEAEIPEGAVVVGEKVMSADGKVELGTIVDGVFVPNEAAVTAVGGQTLDSAVGTVAEGKVAGEGIAGAAERASVIGGNGTTKSVMEQLGINLSDGQLSTGEIVGGVALALAAAGVLYLMFSKTHLTRPGISRG